MHYGTLSLALGLLYRESSAGRPTPSHPASSSDGTLMDGLTLEDFWVSRITAFNSCSALILLVWDWLICLDEEITWVWPQSNSAIYKWLYLICRYFALGCQLFDVLFVRRMEQYVPLPPSACRMWLAYQGIVVEVFLGLVEALLMIKIYALWGRNRRIFVVLVLFMVVEVSSSIISTTFATGDTVFNQLCLFKKPPLLFMFFIVAALTTQLSIITLMIYKKSPWRCPQRPCIVTSVIREGNVVSFTICALLTVYLLLDTEYSDIMFYWILSILSVCGCRLVLSVHRFYHSSNHEEMSVMDEVFFTSICVIEQEPDVSA